jgi:hypothetical protein
VYPPTAGIFNITKLCNVIADAGCKRRKGFIRPLLAKRKKEAQYFSQIPAALP